MYAALTARFSSRVFLGGTYLGLGLGLDRRMRRDLTRSCSQEIQSDRSPSGMGDQRRTDGTWV